MFNINLRGRLDARRELKLRAAILGSSHYDLPAVLRWFTANIGVHHVHHLCSRIPFYRLRRSCAITLSCELAAGHTRVKVCRAFDWRLWDEAKQKLVSFREV